MAKFTIPTEEYMNPGHVGCLGCGACHAMRYTLKALGPRTIVSIPACCWAVMPGPFPAKCLEVPLINTAFEVTGASISGIRAALDAKGITDVTVVGFAGDGGTADIGIQALSGMVERGTDVIYIMYDNEAYMNTGIQRSSSTPKGAWTTTTPVGTTKDWKKQPKKNMMDIMVAHKIPYAATCSVGYPEDMIKKLRKAKEIRGPKFIQIFAPCPTGWRMQPEKTIEVCKLAVSTGAVPLYEVENGVYTITRKPRELKPVKEYLALQGRFRHLPQEEIDAFQNTVTREWKRLLKMEEFTKELVNL